MQLRITAAPKIRQLYWCDFRGDILLPEMGKKRPVLIVSYRNTLHGIVLVVPISTDTQEGISAQWAYKLSVPIDESGRQSWVVCNHLYTVSTKRLEPLRGRNIPRLDEPEFDAVMSRIAHWLPSLPSIPLSSDP